MTSELQFHELALKEWRKLGAPIQKQFKKKLAERLETPHVTGSKLSGMPDSYKIKLRSSGYRLVYQVRDEKLWIMVIAVGKRDRSAVYRAAAARLK